jgi:hypothetical protein
VVGGEPGVESVGQIVGIQQAEQVVEGLVAGSATAVKKGSVKNI